MSATVDLTKFKDAFGKYLLVTSRDMATALNGKMRDAMFLSVKYGPNFNAEYSAEDYKRVRSPAFITYKTIQKYGANPEGASRSRRLKKDGSISSRKGSFKGLGQVWGMVERNKVARRLRKRMSGLRGYMASAFIKAGIQFAPAASKVRKPPQKYKGNVTSAQVVHATPQSLVSRVLLKWSAKSSKDADEKEALATRGLNAGFREVTLDMIKYMNDKAAKNARSVSA